MPETKGRVGIEIYVDDNGTHRVRQVSDDIQGEFRKTEKAGTRSASSISSAWDKAKGLWGWIAGGATAAVGAVSALVVTSANEAREMENLARLANMGAKEFKEYAFATSTVNVSAEKLADISKDVQDKLGDFIATGGGEFKDFFEEVAPKVGLTAKELQNLSGPDVLVAVKKAMDDANVSAEEQVFYMESIANDATVLLPLLQDNGKALKEQAKRASELGVALDEVDSKKLKDAGKATKEMTGAFNGLKNKIAAEFAPVFESVMNWATEKMIEFKDEAVGASKAVANVFHSFEGWSAVLNGRKLSFFEFATMDAKELSEWLEKNSKEVRKLESELHDVQSEIGALLEKQNRIGLSENEEKILQSYRDQIKEIEAQIKSKEEVNELSEKEVETQKKLEKQVSGVTTSMAKQQADRTKALNELLKKEEKIADDRVSAENEMYEKAGIGAERYFSNQATELIKQADLWRDNGGETLAVETWLYDELGKLSQQAMDEGQTMASIAMDNLQAQTSTLIDELNEQVNEGVSHLQELGVNVSELDGLGFTLYATLDGSGVMSQIDQIINRFQHMQNTIAGGSAPSSAGDGSSSSNGSNGSNDTSSNSNATTINNYINQKQSRGDIADMNREQERNANRL